MVDLPTGVLLNVQHNAPASLFEDGGFVMERRKTMTQFVEGVDNTPEGIEDVRQELVEHRNQALGMGEMRYAVLMSHVIAYLAELKSLKTGGA